MSDSVPRRRIEVLYQDIMGEIGPLMTRLEEVTSKTSQLLDSTHRLPEDLAESVHRTAALLDKQTAREVRELTTRLDSLVESTRRHATLAEKAARKVLFLTVLVGALAGGIAGVVAGWVVGQFWLYS